MPGKYIPPNKRKQNNNNRFRSKSKTPPPPAPEVDNLENFPTLGDSAPVIQEETSMNYAEYIKKMYKKKKPEIEPGWVKIYKKDKKIKYKFGKRPRKDHVYLRNVFNEAKCKHAIKKLEDRLDQFEYNEELQDEISGKNVIYSWEVSEYIKERNHVDYSDESESESDYITDDDEINED